MYCISSFYCGTLFCLFFFVAQLRVRFLVGFNFTIFFCLNFLCFPEVLRLVGRKQYF